ncbi:MAG TPA: dihydrodipicolinate synthase family protein [Candidatus Hydrogenedentes bacterium]|nr:dihydrodipicolinate synthase family protein [Candidatus Hydrogenedentota bacterium]HPG66121.1 dihydrodipicolinate synthase family protein [Candidatus Hydrogenedentota bacterium]
MSKDPPFIRAALTGPIASISTPFTRDGSVDSAALRTIVDFSVDAGSRTVLLTYGDSLYSLLTDNEVAEVTRIVAQHTAGRAIVVAADRMWATPKEVAFAQYARDVGADVLMVLPPDWAQSCTLESLVEHYTAVAREIPVMAVTNYLGQRPAGFGIELMQRLTEVPGVVAVKDDVGGAFAQRLGQMLYGRLALISGGQKRNHMDMHPHGCDGYLSTFMRFYPQIARTYWSFIEANDIDAANTIIRKYDVPLFDFILSSRGSFDAAIHGLLELFGIAGRWRRKPYHSCTDAEMERLGAFLTQLGITRSATRLGCQSRGAEL